eukprot:TRINITY_DN4271_c0_g1_i2.p1 TRINITY_DN4271_c0_g1~~TRINITY_DN4271_c0_g1_i2.p1  ORF type:complete len:457 (-),score=43.83 TRINITY_DN4271_c0_g1_i2:307-1677(-)
MEKKDRGDAAHVLLLPYPSQGHINPMLQFAKRLASKGLRATLATTHFIAKSFKVESGSVGVESISDGCDDGGFAEVASVQDYLERLEDVGSRTLAELIEKLASSKHPITCLVYDTFLPWALGVAARQGLTKAAFSTQSCAVGDVYYHAYHRQLSIPVEGPTLSLPKLPPLGIPDLPSFVCDCAIYPAYLALVLNQFSNLEKADWVLFNTFSNLEPEVVNWFESLYPMKAIGPTVPSMYLDKRVREDNDYGLSLYNPDSRACIKWLDERANGSVIYVSFGSMVALAGEQMVELTWALKACKHHFLLVVRASEEHKLPDKYIEETANKGLVVTWSPQLEVLAHQALGCFVTHCGWNSTVEALSLGVPMVAMPQWTDQTTNAKYVEDVWKVGVRVKADEKGLVSRGEIEVCIKEVMEGERAEEIKRNACKWKEIARGSVDEGGSSDKNIDQFVASIVSK